jgi:uncharacterized protein (DUF58 family)
MKWILGIAGLLILGLVFHLNLLVYAMYVLAGVLMVGRFLARSWTENLVARRAAVIEACEIGESVKVTVELENRGRLTVRGEVSAARLFSIRAAAGGDRRCLWFAPALSIAH